SEKPEFPPPHVGGYGHAESSDTLSIPHAFVERAICVLQKPFEMVAGVTVVIEIQFKNPGLQKSPHCFAHIRSQPHDSQSTEVGGPHLAKIILQKPVFLFALEEIIRCQISQVEEQISRAAVFPVENPNLTSVINQVAGQQIIVAMAYTIGNTSLI